MQTVHKSTPEPIVFLRLAAMAMEEFKEEHGRYARDWVELGFTFANGPYHVSDPDIRPDQDSRLVWRPRKAEHRYRIRSEGDAEGFVLEALGDDGEVVYRMTESDEVPVAGAAAT